MQNSVNHRTFERIWRFQVPPGSMPLRVASPPPLGARDPGRPCRNRPLRARCLGSAARTGSSAGFLWTGRGACRRVSFPIPLGASPAGVLVWSFPHAVTGAWGASKSRSGGFRPFGPSRGARASVRVPPLTAAPSLREGAALLTRHRMEQDYPLNLSISLSGGEETNQDAPSNGE